MAESKKTKKSVELHGKVKDCKFLRLRKEPSFDAECLALLSSEELLIDKKNSTNDFYKVAVLGLDEKTCNEGYVSKSYVETFEVKKAEPVLEENKEEVSAEEHVVEETDPERSR